MPSKQCEACSDGFYRCGSYQFNLHQQGIEQGNLCDVHYWEVQAGRYHESLKRISAMDHRASATKPC